MADDLHPAVKAKLSKPRVGFDPVYDALKRAKEPDKPPQDPPQSQPQK